jgi:hypothetical protein
MNMSKKRFSNPCEDIYDKYEDIMSTYIISPNTYRYPTELLVIDMFLSERVEDMVRLAMGEEE